MINYNNYLKKLVEIENWKDLKKLNKEYQYKLKEFDSGWKLKFIAWSKKRDYNFSSGSITNLLHGGYGGAKGTQYKQELYRKKTSYFIEKTNEYISEEKARRGTSFENTSWYVYFFYPVPPSEKRVRLGRCIIHFSEGRIATLENIQEDNSGNKKGRYIILNDTIFIDLEALESKEKQVHIKVNRDAIPSEIMLGGFVSRERRTITVGTLIFRKVNDNEFCHAAALSAQSNRKEFIETPLAIRNYLSSKRMNFSKISNAIYKTSHLTEQIREHKTNSFTRFFEPENPIIYISSPVTSLTGPQKEINHEKILLLQKNLEDYFKTYNLESVFLSTKSIYENDYSQVFKYLKKTTFFVFIYPEKVVSNSLVELGIALSHSKRIFLFSPKKVLPEKIGNFARGNNQCSFFAIDEITNKKNKSQSEKKKIAIQKVFDSNFDKIQKELELEIMKFLKKEYQFS